MLCLQLVFTVEKLIICYKHFSNLEKHKIIDLCSSVAFMLHCILIFLIINMSVQDTTIQLMSGVFAQCVENMHKLSQSSTSTYRFIKFCACAHQLSCALHCRKETAGTVCEVGKKLDSC